jgi:hypothetical protein
VASVTPLRPRRRARWLGTSAGLLLAAAAAFLFVLRPWGLSRPTDRCDIEALEVAGGTATVLTLDNVIAKGDATTVIWTEED